MFSIALTVFFFEGVYFFLRLDSVFVSKVFDVFNQAGTLEIWGCLAQPAEQKCPSKKHLGLYQGTTSGGLTDSHIPSNYRCFLEANT